MMKITEHEMRGLLTGRCIPGDMKVNEQLAEYLVRKFSDLHEQLTATTNSLTNAQEALKSAGIEADTVQVGVMELKAQRDALAADNAALKTFINQSCYSYDGDGSDVCDSYVGADESPFFPKTAATDAHLNAVRAEGVEMFAELHDAVAENYRSESPGCYGEQLHQYASSEAVKFSTHLRSINTSKGFK